MSTSFEASAEAAAEDAAAANTPLNAKAVKDQLLIMRSVLQSIQTMNNHISEGNDNLRKVKSRVKSNLEEQPTLWSECKCFFRHKSLCTLQEVEFFRQWAFAKVLTLQKQEQQLENELRVHIQNEAFAAQPLRQEASIALDKSTTPSKEPSFIVPGPLESEYHNKKAKLSIRMIIKQNQSEARIKRLDEESQAKIKRKKDEENALAQIKLDRKELENQARIKRKVDELKALAQVRSDLRAPQQERIQKEKDDHAKDKAEKKRERQERDEEDQRHREEKAQKKLKKQEQLKQEEQEKRQKMEAQVRKRSSLIAQQLKTMQEQKHWRAMFALCYRAETSACQQPVPLYSFLDETTFGCKDMDIKFELPKMMQNSLRTKCQGDCGLPFEWAKNSVAIEDGTLSPDFMHETVLTNAQKLPKNKHVQIRKDSVVLRQYFHCRKCYDQYTEIECGFKAGVFEKWKNNASMWKDESDLHLPSRAGMTDYWSPHLAFEKHPVHGRIREAYVEEHHDIYNVNSTEFCMLVYTDFTWTPEMAELDRVHNPCGDCRLKQSELQDKCEIGSSKVCLVCKKLRETEREGYHKLSSLNKKRLQDEQMAHLQYTFSFYWSGSAVTDWQSLFKNRIEEEIQGRKCLRRETQVLIDKRRAQIKASLDADNHEQRYAVGKQQRFERDTRRAEEIEIYKRKEREMKERCHANYLIQQEALQKDREEQRRKPPRPFKTIDEINGPLIAAAYANFQWRPKTDADPQSSHCGNSS